MTITIVTHQRWSQSALTSGWGHVSRRGPCPPLGLVSAQPGNVGIADGRAVGAGHRQQWRGAVASGGWGDLPAYVLHTGDC